MNEDIQKIADGLTKAQAKRLEGLYQLRTNRKTWMSAHGSIYLGTAKASSEALIDLGLVDRKNASKASTGRWLDRCSGELTPLGQQVRAYLQGKQS